MPITLSEARVPTKEEEEKKIQKYLTEKAINGIKVRYGVDYKTAEKIFLDFCADDSKVIKDAYKLEQQNQELRVKCNKLLNDNFLLVAQYTNMVEDNTRLKLDNKALKELNKKYKKQLKELKGE